MLICNNYLMKSSNFVKNIISKDTNTFFNTLNNLINSKDIGLFKELDESSDFIFPFVKEKIINEFVKLINKENLDVVFEFMNYYSYDFEDMVLRPLLKHADEDLTDKILEIFEQGNEHNKAYCAKYFTKIKDTLALPLLKKEAMSDFYYLKINCAKALRGFCDTEALNKAKEIVLNSSDEYEKLDAFEFIIAYGNEARFILENCFNLPFSQNIIANLLDENGFDEIKKANEGKISDVFCVLLEGYPENISLNTIKYYEIAKFIRYLSANQTNYNLALLLCAKAKFDEFANNDNYTFDLDNDLKNELKNINSLLKDIDFKKLAVEYKSGSEFQAILNVIREFDCNEFDIKLSDIINSQKNKEVPATLLVEALGILHTKNKINLIDKKIIEDIKTIENTNLKAIAMKYLN